MASLALHIGIGLFLASTDTGVHNAYRPSARINVHLLAATLTRKNNLADAADEVSREASTGKPDGTLTQQAKFLTSPDFSGLQELPVLFAGEMTLRLHISALGRIEKVTVIRSDPVAKDFLERAKQELLRTPMTPAQEGERRVASTMDLVIRYEPETGLPAELGGSAKLK